jgi:hypothetical protein
MTIKLNKRRSRSLVRIAMTSPLVVVKATFTLELSNMLGTPQQKGRRRTAVLFETPVPAAPQNENLADS